MRASGLYFNSLQFWTNPCISTKFHTIPYNSVQFRTIPCNFVQFRTIPYNSVQFRAIEFRCSSRYSINNVFQKKFWQVSDSGAFAIFLFGLISLILNYWADYQKEIFKVKYTYLFLTRRNYRDIYMNLHTMPDLQWFIWNLILWNTKDKDLIWLVFFYFSIVSYKQEIRKSFWQRTHKWKWIVWMNINKYISFTLDLRVQL